LIKGPYAARSLAWRAAIALALLGGFYVLGIAIAGLLIWIPYAEFHYLGRIDLRIALWCIVGAVAILLSFRPRRDVFRAPGPQLTEADHPELFRMIREIASETRQDMPVAVYLVPAVNAFVQQRGGVSGVGTHRIMGIGHPLLQMLSVSEIRAVVAHEFGHYVAGDVALGPIVYRTWQSIARTGTAVSGSILQFVFVLYAKLFIRTSMRVSRHQEYSADRLAARVAGAASLISGLKKLPSATIAYQLYLSQTVAPLLKSNVVPPIVDGFVTFSAQPALQALFADPRLINEAQPSPYDSHPPLRDRLVALESLNQPEARIDTRPGLALLGPQSWDEAFAGQLVPSNHTRRVVSWDDAFVLAQIPAWQQLTNVRRKRLSTIVCDQIPTDTTSTAALSRAIKETIDKGTADEEVAARLASVVAMAIGLRLFASGWRFHHQPGQPVRAERDGTSVELFENVSAVMTGSANAEEWRRFCREAGLAGQPLLDPPPAAPHLH